MSSSSSRSVRKRVITEVSSTSATKRGKKFTDDSSDDSVPPAKTIADMDDKILQKILEFAAVKTKWTAGFLDASLVCKKWNELLSQSNIIMNKLRPEITLQYTKNAANSSKFCVTRPYRRLEISFFSTYDFEEGKVLSTNPVLILSTIASSPSLNQLRCLTLRFVPLTAYIFGTLHWLDKLESLSIFHCIVEDDLEIQPVELKSLKRLCIEYTDAKILSVLGCKELDLLGISTETQRFDKHIATFLKQLERVDHLELESHLGVFNLRLCNEAAKLDIYDGDDEIAIDIVRDFLADPKHKYKKLVFAVHVRSIEEICLPRMIDEVEQLELT